jgi:tetratricopeptide (TPR) repeat protein
MGERRSNVRFQQALGSLREQIFERAFLYAVVGEIDDLREIIEVARAVNPIGDTAREDENWFLTLEGIAHFHRGEYPQAVSKLERALAENDRNVSALGVLALAYVHVGRERVLEILPALKDASPRPGFADYDALFLGYGHFYVDYTVAATELEAVLRDKAWWFAPRAVLASAWAHAARDRGETALIERAISELVVPQSHAEASPFLQTLILYVYDSAIELCGRNPEWESQATRLALELETSHPNLLLGALVRGTYFEQINDEERAMRAWRIFVSNSSDEGNFVSFAASAMYRRGQDATLLKELEGKGDSAEIYRAYVLATSAQDSDRAQALAIFEKLRDKPPLWQRRAELIQVPLLLGDTEAAKEQARSWLQNTAPDEGHNYDWARECIELVAGVAPETFAVDSPDPRVRWNVKYQTAFLQYAEGNYQAALQHFSYCGARGNTYPSKMWAKAFQARLPAAVSK